MIILAIETSCDDTSVSILESKTADPYAVTQVLSLVSANQDLVHKPFGGIVPEIASRNHTHFLLPLVNEALAQAGIELSQLEGVAVTSRPGLMGALLVGVVTAKTLAMNLDIPFIGINHLEAHLLAPFLHDNEYKPEADPAEAYVALAVSGGHTQIYHAKNWGEYQVLGKALDDAAGEAFDKFAKMVGLGFPGGPQVDKASQGGHPKAYHFVRPLMKEGSFNFSFSGLKTAAMRLLETMSDEDVKNHLSDLCASYQEAVVDVLIHKLDLAVKQTGLSTVVITGGVSANSRLRECAEVWAQKNNYKLLIPPLRFCTDNAAMVGIAGMYRLKRGESSAQDLKPAPNSYPEDFQSESR